MADSKFLNDYFTIGGDLKVRRFGFGAMRITGKGIWGQPKDHKEAVAVVKRAVELGINFIDTADSYGPYVSEEILAEALYPYPADLVIATKGGLLRPGPDNWVPDGRPEHLKEALEGSLKRLKADRIDVYQFHRPDPKVPFEESVGFLAEMKKQGKIRHIGLSNVNEEQLKQAQAIVEIVSVQNLYNLSNRSSESLVDVTNRQNIGFIPWFPLATGKLAESGGKLEEIAKNHGATPSQVALAWLLKRSPNMLPIAGTGSVEHLEENIKGADIELTDDEFKALDQASA
ncbi:MAG: aldo/keto reductase [Chloroflexi bacterium]|nr:aldo/keto reductase [Chloroflexota bacterium]OJV97072.1 MAG: oxidoreductase [Chloroflexi bacterium 54-19]